MLLSGNPSVQRRRKGAELDAALLDAAWDELVERGYDAFTMDAVASRAQAARTVLYRRWSTKQDLVKAAIRNRGFQQTIEVPDTGSLRGDLIQFMNNANGSRAQKGIALLSRLGALYSDTGTNLGELRQGLVEARSEAIDRMLQRAVDRGEIDPAKLTPRVRSVAFDLFLHELMMTMRPVSSTAIADIIDEIFLPLVRVA
ncbi:TetR/AcrR family transcriptional regulator [Gryllotalpicola protaetiae]|uniref:TetR/AcrR family transcriptional regulator n=1 Tax=Gryllotalpicola protaetiae TaxID=2419771 RepID=A0A387BSN3_9MICO|nr:TetR/AcrR family transcriptional regulator [Gryllotalpicola protaetiae]AYG04036.1 TetR/AcrR family transcriptional regulator [Gryllotalpicola protaetiae]